MKISKKIGLAIVVAAALSAGLPRASHATTYLLDLDSSGNALAAPAGTVDIAGDGTTLTYQFNLTSGTLSAVYMDVLGSVSGVSTNGAWSADLGIVTTPLGAFSNSLICNGDCGAQLTAIFSGTDLVASFTLSDGGAQMFSAANTSNGFFGDQINECDDAALTPSDGGLTPATLLAALTSAIVTPAHATDVDPCAAVMGATPVPATLPLFAAGLGALGLLGWRRKRRAQACAAA
jgi:hypothetical protein